MKVEIQVQLTRAEVRQAIEDFVLRARPDLAGMKVSDLRFYPDVSNGDRGAVLYAETFAVQAQPVPR